MDSARFDSLARSLAGPRSRRGALAAVMAGALGVAGLAETEAKKKKPCSPCKKRKNGKCKPDPDKAGKPCGGCRLCGENGACLPSDALCADGQTCRPSTGICCPVCINGGCCGVKEACVNPGLLSNNFCCDTRVNTPCGAKGNGVFTECCSNRTEVCCGDTCVPKGQCRNCANNDVWTVQCAEDGDSWCCDENSPVCCRDGDGDPHCCSR